MTQYPRIMKACQLIALDNGGINITRPQDQQEQEAKEWLEDVTLAGVHDVVKIEAYLATLTDEQLDLIVTDSEDPVAVDLIALGPPDLEEFLDKYFEEVC